MWKRQLTAAEQIEKREKKAFKEAVKELKEKYENGRDQRRIQAMWQKWDKRKLEIERMLWEENCHNPETRRAEEARHRIDRIIQKWEAQRRESKQERLMDSLAPSEAQSSASTLVQRGSIEAFDLFKDIDAMFDADSDSEPADFFEAAETFEADPTITTGMTNMPVQVVEISDWEPFQSACAELVFTEPVEFEVASTELTESKQADHAPEDSQTPPSTVGSETASIELTELKHADFAPENPEMPPSKEEQDPTRMAGLHAMIMTILWCFFFALLLFSFFQVLIQRKFNK